MQQIGNVPNPHRHPIFIPQAGARGVNKNQGCPLSAPPIPSFSQPFPCFFTPSHFPPFPPPLPSLPAIPHPVPILPLQVGPLKPASGSGERCKLIQLDQGRSHRTSGSYQFNDFSEKQVTKFHAEFPNFMQNLLIY